MNKFSISPDGTKYKLPTPQDYKKEFAHIEKLAAKAKKNNQEIVVGKIITGLIRKQKNLES